MSDYQPTSRRPIAGLFRRTADGAVRLCVRLGIHPDLVSYASIVAAAAAGACFWQSARWPYLLLGGIAGCFLRLWFNMLDGMVALASKQASRRGELLNDLPDRVSDVLIFVGVAHSGLCHPLSGYWTAIFALLVAYVGMFGQALGVQREFSGWMSKPWRMVTLSAAAVVVFVLLLTGDAPAPVDRTQLGPLTVFDWTSLLIIAGCLQTIAIRIVRILRALDQQRTPGT